MSHSVTYKGNSYASRSQAALAMLADKMTMKQIARELEITPQTVFASKRRAERRLYHIITKLQKQSIDTMQKAKQISEKTNHLSKIYGSLGNINDGRIKMSTRKIRESRDLNAT